MPDDRYIDGVDQTSFLLGDDGESNRKFLYYWLGRTFSALRVGEYKFMLASTSDDDRDVLNLGGFTGVDAEVHATAGSTTSTSIRRRRRSYMIRKLAYLDSLTDGVRRHFMTFGKYPPKQPIAAMT